MREETRRLAGILAADVVDYSAMVASDEPTTLARVRALRTEVIEPLAATHDGRLFKTMGDGFLLEFASAVQALRCAIAIQTTLNAQEDGLGLRIGVHQGEVVPAGDDLFGDGVIIAARLEPLAEQGGIVISSRVKEDASGKMVLEVDDLGEPSLKNIAAKIRVFRVNFGAAEGRPERRVPEALPAPAPEFEDKPSVAVLPFQNMTGDSELEYFTDGLTDELINALSAWRSFPVIARNSTFMFKGRDVDVRVAGRELGTRYIVSGSVRRRGQRVRVILQLSDVSTGEALISERFDHTGTDLLDLQDDIVLSIAGVLAPEVLKVERERFARRTPSEGSVYELYERGMWHGYRNTKQDLERAEEFFQATLKLDPHYARATAALSLCKSIAAIIGWATDVPAAFAESLTLAQRAVADDQRDPHAHFALGVVCMNVRRLPEAITELSQALRLNPSHAFAHANLGQVFNYLNRPGEGLAEVELALRLNPHDPRRFMWLPYVATSHYLGRRYEACLDTCEQALLANPNPDYPSAVRYMVAALGQLGRAAEARPLLPLLQRYDGDLAGLEARARHYFQEDAAEHLLDGFRRAGFS